MNKTVVEIVVNQTLLELLDKVQDARIEIVRRTRVVGKLLLGGNVTVHDFLGKNIFLVQKQHNRSIGKGSIVAH